MSITNPTYRHYNNWMSGMSDDSYIAAQGQYAYGFGVDIRRNPRYVQLQRKQVKKFTTTDLVNAFWTIGGAGTPGGSTFAFDNAGKVYYIDGVNVYTAPAAIFGVIEFQSTLYMFTNNTALTIATSNCATTVASWGAFITSTGTGSARGSRHAINYLDAKLFFTEDKKLRYFDSAAPTTPVDTAFSSNSSIAGITQHGDSIWVYCQDGKMYAYDIGNNVVIGTKDFQERISFVRPNADVDIVVTSTSYYATAWINSGVQPGSQALLKKAKYDETVAQVYSVDTMFGFFGAATGSQNGCNLRSTVRMFGADGTNSAIYSYGKKGDGFPFGWSVDYTKNADGNAINTLGSMFRTSVGFMYSWKYNSTYGVDWVDTENVSPNNGYLASGELFTLWDDSCLSLQSVQAEEDREMRKEISFVKMGAIIPTGCTISLYYLLDGQAGTGTLYKTWGPSDAVDGSSFREFSPISTQFTQIRWRIVLNGSGSATPRLFDLKYALQPVNEA